MASEIDKYLFEKFKNAVDAQDSKGYPTISLYDDFKQLKDQLWSNIDSSSSQGNSSTSKPSKETSIRHSLYYLNNIVIDCHTTSNKRLFPQFGIKRSLNRIKDEIRSINQVKQGPRSTHQGYPQEANQQQRSTPQGGKENNVGSAGSSSGDSQSFGWSSPDLDREKIYGFKEPVENLEKSLIREVPFKAIGIVGISGIGKTTLCQMFFNSDKVMACFFPRIWVPVSRIRVSVSGQPNEEACLKEAITKGMLMQLGAEEEVVENDFSHHQLGGLLSLLHQHLWGKRYLIVFDDVRFNDVAKSEEWYQDLGACLQRERDWGEKLAHGLPKGHGGTVIVTSRSEEAAKKMVGRENLHEQMPLKEGDHCWRIFKDAAGSEDGNIEHEIKEKREIKEKCKGVPLAAKVMGQLVKKRIEEQSQNSNINGH